MFRTGLKITKREASPADVRALVAAMDADGSGTLSLAELAAFVGNRPVSPGKSKMKRRMIKKTTAFFPAASGEPLAPPYRARPASIQRGRVDGVTWTLDSHRPPAHALRRRGPEALPRRRAKVAGKHPHGHADGAREQQLPEERESLAAVHAQIFAGGFGRAQDSGEGRRRSRIAQIG